MFFCLVSGMALCVSVYMCLVVTRWKGLTPWLSFVSLLLSHWYPGSGVVLDRIDSLLTIVARFCMFTRVMWT